MESYVVRRVPSKGWIRKRGVGDGSLGGTPKSKENRDWIDDNRESVGNPCRKNSKIAGLGDEKNLSGRFLSTTSQPIAGGNPKGWCVGCICVSNPGATVSAKS